MQDKFSLKELENAVLKNNPLADRDLMRKSYDFARGIHSGQVRDEGSPYFAHPYRVAMYLAENMKIGDAGIIATALLHDVIEDGPGVTRSVIEKEFGETVAGHVNFLSKRKIPGMDRLIKMADRLDNIRSIHLILDKDKFKRYLKETRKIYLPMAKKNFPSIAVEMGSILNKFE